MDFVLFADNTLPFQLPALCDVLNDACGHVTFNPGEQRIRLTASELSVPRTYDALPDAIKDECEKHMYALIGTAIPYDNNFFFEWDTNKAFISFSDWNHYTDLPVTNGFVYFIASILADIAGVGETHKNNTGCVNDFWWDKTGINLGMRAAYVCPICKSTFQPTEDWQSNVLRDTEALLDLVSRASRADSDVLSSNFATSSNNEDTFDAFLCHNSADKPTVRDINDRLKTAGLSTWIDEDQLAGGDPWQVKLENQIASVHAAAVFVGANATGPWQAMEIRGFLSEFVDRGCPVIPVILPDAPSVPDLPLFLKQLTWIDLRKDFDNGILRLIATLRRR